MILLNPYKKGSRSAKALKQSLTAKGFKTLIGSKPPVHAGTLLVSWGNSDFGFPLDRYVNVVNHPSALTCMTNKLRFFHRVGQGTGMVPEWTTSRADASKWGCKLLARQKLEASGGAGIVVCEPGMEIPPAPLYVKYENKTHEFRLHMARSLRGNTFEPILIQRKIFQKTPDRPFPADWNIRNHGNGFVFVQESNFPTPKSVVELCQAFMVEHFRDMHFCALDVIYHEKRRSAYILEGNTAPGMEGNTVAVYTDYISGLAKEARA